MRPCLEFTRVDETAKKLCQSLKHLDKKNRPPAHLVLPNVPTLFVVAMLSLSHQKTASCPSTVPPPFESDWMVLETKTASRYPP